MGGLRGPAVASFLVAWAPVWLGVSMQAYAARTRAGTWEDALRNQGPPERENEGSGDLRSSFERAVALSKGGRFSEAADVYAQIVASGRADSIVYANLAEVLMASGRLRDAAARYRDAIAAAWDEPTGVRRARSQDLALAYYGLAVAYDRQDRPIAAREMMGRALAEDPGASLLKVAATPGSDLQFVPRGEVFYYLGLAAEVEGRDVDAEAAFREFLAVLPTSPWAELARTHADGRRLSLAAPGDVDATADAAREHRPPLQVVAVGTVLASGPIPAPLIDAAWRAHPNLLDDCLSRAPNPVSTTAGTRFALELQIDARGVVTGATAKVTAPLDAAFARCAEEAARRTLRFHPDDGPRHTSRRGRGTIARTEVLLGSR